MAGWSSECDQCEWRYVPEFSPGLRCMNGDTDHLDCEDANPNGGCPHKDDHVGWDGPADVAAS